MTIKNNLLVSIIWLLSAGFMWATPPANQLLDKVIATIDNQIVLQSELEREYQYYQAQGGKETADFKNKIFEGLLINKMLLARAEIEEGMAKPEEIERVLNYRMQYFISQAGSEERLEYYTGKSIQSFQEELRKALKEQLTIEKMRNKIVEGIGITPVEVQAYFRSLAEPELPYYPTEVEVRQIVCFPKLGQQDKAAVIDQLKDLKARIQAGESFAELAQQYSEDNGSASNGGELGFWRIGELTPAYESAILSAKPNEIVGPVETPFGFHLIQLIERQADRYNSRHILLKGHASKAAVEETIVRLQGIRTDIVEQRMTFEKAAVLYSDDPETASQGGLLNRDALGNRIPLDALPPDIFLMVDRLQPGTISAVDEFVTSTGEKAIRLIYLKQRIPAHQATLQQDYEKIYQMALDNKKELALKQWFQHVKDEINLKVDPAYQNCKILN